MRKILVTIFLLFSATAFAQPQLKGGLETYILSNLVYPAYSLQNCIDGQVKIAFQLNQAGDVTYSTIQSGVGTDLDEEALRLIRKSTGKWIIPQDYDTTALVVVPVNFSLDDANCRNKTRASVQQAIAAYQSQKGLEDAILNYYRNKEAGKANAEEEKRYIALKKELGYDEAYMKQRIEMGEEKLQQNDKQGACEDFQFVKYMGFELADELLKQHCANN
ncbi:TonB family protein [Pedobacter sp. CAN_A7]|uniref:TonB family protein n=1 Tax=Pedobacter sp. CAN_A7 TaxID=2787722 RepID=UPI0018CA3E0E